MEGIDSYKNESTNVAKYDREFCNRGHKNDWYKPYSENATTRAEWASLVKVTKSSVDLTAAKATAEIEFNMPFSFNINPT